MNTTLDSIGDALGRLPSGIFILTTEDQGRWTGMLASWVQQAGFEPPMVTVAIRKDRYVADWVERSGRFTLQQVAAGHKALLKHFGKGFEPGEDAFQGLPIREDAEHGPILSEALGAVAAEVAGHIDGGDHRIFLGRLVAAQRRDDHAEPMIHLRKSGLHY